MSVSPVRSATSRRGSDDWFPDNTGYGDDTELQGLTRHGVPDHQEHAYEAPPRLGDEHNAAGYSTVAHEVTQQRDRFSGVTDDDSNIKSGHTVTVENAHAKPPRRIRHQNRKETLSVWLWELLALLGSILLFIVIIIILTRFNRQPQPSWSRITVPGIVATLGTFIAALIGVPIASGLGQLKWLWFKRRRPLSDFEVFDEASRGPLGSVKMVYKGKAR